MQYTKKITKVVFAGSGEAAGAPKLAMIAPGQAGTAAFKRLAEENDILVLCESGTRLSTDWAGELQLCIESDTAVAAAMPLCTDSADYPAEAAWLAEDGSFRLRENVLRDYPALTAVDGCCLALRCDALQETGIFDEEIPVVFSQLTARLCALLRQRGRQVCLCDAVLAVAPQGGDKSKAGTQQKPQDLAYLTENLRMAALLHNGRKNLLFLNHRDFRKDAADHIGGTQLHVRDMTLELQKRYNVFVLARSRQDFLLTAYLGDKTLSYQIYSGEVSPYPVLHDEGQRALYAALLDTLHIDMVHVHNLFELSLDMLWEANKRRLPLAFTIHDYYALCPTAMMLDAQGELCLATRTDEGCKKCLLQNRGIENGDCYLHRWREQFGAALQLCNVIFAPSQIAADTIAETYPQLKQKLRVLPHGITLPDTGYRPQPDGRVLRVAVLGNVSRFKGSALLYQMITTADRKKFEWSLLGGSAEPELFFLKQSNYYKSDWYPRSKLPELMKQRRVDVVCLPSVCSETYCYTLTEAAFCGVPCVVSEVGALGERVRQSGAGWLMPVGSSAAQYMELLEHLRLHPEEIRQKAERTKALAGRTVAHMAAEYAPVYDELMAAATPVYGTPQQMLLYRAGYTGGAVTAPPPGEQAGTAERMRRAEARLAEIEHSRVYNAMLVLKRVFHPLLGPLMGLAGKVINALHLKV